MSLSGTVIQVQGDLIEVSVVPHPECQGCKTCQSLVTEDSAKERIIKAFRGEFALAPGDQVTLDLLPGMGSVAALILFAFPLAGFFVGIWAGPHLAILLGFSGGESAAFLCGVVGFLLAMGVIGLVNRFGGFQRLQLRVIAKTS